MLGWKENVFKINLCFHLYLRFYVEERALYVTCKHLLLAIQQSRFLFIAAKLESVECWQYVSKFL